MRKIIVLSMISLDGVMQAPGGPEEDTSGGFKYGGWVAPYNDEAGGNIMQKIMQPADVFLGRKTFQIWEHYWPQHEQFWPGINDVTKYVFSNTIGQTEWQNCIFMNSLSDIEKLRNSDGADIQVWGSSKLVQLLLKNNLVDELWLMIHPLILGAGKKLFDNEASAAAFTVAETTVTSTGVIMAHYVRAGEVKTGSIGE